VRPPQQPRHQGDDGDRRTGEDPAGQLVGLRGIDSRGRAGAAGSASGSTRGLLVRRLLRLRRRVVELLLDDRRVVLPGQRPFDPRASPAVTRRVQPLPKVFQCLNVW
jgi:hypothetical protein